MLNRKLYSVTSQQKQNTLFISTNKQIKHTKAILNLVKRSQLLTYPDFLYRF